MFEDLEQTYLNAHYKYTVGITTFVLVPNYTIEGHVAGVWHAKKYQAANPSILLHASGSFLCCGIQFLTIKAFLGSAFFTKINFTYLSPAQSTTICRMRSHQSIESFCKHSKSFHRDQCNVTSRIHHSLEGQGLALEVFLGPSSAINTPRWSTVLFEVAWLYSVTPI